MKSSECKSETMFDSSRLAGLDPENPSSGFFALGWLQLRGSVAPGSLLAALHPCHFLCLQHAASADLALRLVYSGVSAICSVAPFAVALIALTLLYLRATRRNLQREIHRLIWLRIEHAIGRDSRLTAASWFGIANP